MVWYVLQFSNILVYLESVMVTGTDRLNQAFIDGWGVKGEVSFKPAVIERSVSNVERLWAYMQIKELLEKKELADKDKEEIKKKALDLALKYSFVTPVSSLVVVKPNATNAVNTEAATGGMLTRNS